MALEAELALTLKVLETMADRSLGDILDQPLHTLRHIHSQLQACVSARGTRALSVGSGHRGPHPAAPGPASHTTLLGPRVKAQPPAGPQPRGRLHPWLHRLHEASKKVSDSRGGWMPGPWVRDGWMQVICDTEWEQVMGQVKGRQEEGRHEERCR